MQKTRWTFEKCSKVCNFSNLDHKSDQREVPGGGPARMESESNNMKGFKGTPGGPKEAPERFSGAAQVRACPKV